MPIQDAILDKVSLCFLARVSHPSDLVLGVKNKIQIIDLPHELCAKFNSWFELLFRFAF